MEIPRVMAPSSSSKGTRRHRTATRCPLDVVSLSLFISLIIIILRHHQEKYPVNQSIPAFLFYSPTSGQFLYFRSNCAGTCTCSNRSTIGMTAWSSSPRFQTTCSTTSLRAETPCEREPSSCGRRDTPSEYRVRG